MRPPQGEDDQRDTQPSEGFQAQVCFLGCHIVDHIVETAEARDPASDAGRQVLVACHVDTDRVRRTRILTHGPQLQAGPCPEQHPAGHQGNYHCQEEQYAQALQAVLPVRERPAVHHLRPDQVDRRVQLAHDHLHQAHAEGCQGKARNVLVRAQRNRQEGIDQSAEHRHDQGSQDTQYHDQERRHAALADHVQNQAAARAAHAHDAGNTQVQVPGLFRQDLTCGTVHERGAECQRVDQEIQPDVHLTASFPASAALWLPRKWIS